ncbi:MAG: hypothetical protein JKX72_00520 [Robiginitomaculum sp.]|nr:hypothetical protein [Robiginitomaculum sp.]
MRILLCGVAAIALSGCSWMHSHDNNATYGQNSYGQSSGSVYTSNTSNTSSSGVTDAWGNPIGYGNQNTVQNQSGTYTTGGYGQNVGAATGGYNNAASYQQPRLRRPSKFGVFGSFGTDIVTGGDAITGNDTLFHPTINMNQVSMKDAFGKALRAELGGTYEISKSNEAILSGFYTKASGKDVVIGQHVSGNPIMGKLTDYKGYGVEAGLRHNMGMTNVPLFSSVKPYIEGRVGAMHLDDISLNNVRVVPGGIPLATQAFYKGGWVPTASGLIGFEKPISRKTSIALETGIRYTGGLDADNTTVTGTFLQGANGGSSRWSVPVQIRGRYRF